MPMFTSSTPYDADVERVTSELNAKEDPNLFRDLCEKVKQTAGSRDCLRSIVKRMNHKVPHVAMQALALLDTCVSRCGYAFQREMATPDFVSECRTFIGSGKAHPKVVQRLKMLIKKWAENEFKSDTALSSIVSLYTSLKSENHNFTFEEALKELSGGPSVQQEDDDLAKAIALSLKESEKHKQQSSLYPSTSTVGSLSSSAASSSMKEPRKVRTLYDFEAAEDNELTFKAGEIISVLDDSDLNWWKGCSYRGEGLFPANFVTADLTAEPDQDLYKSRKSVHFREEVEVKVLEPIPQVLEVDEEKIDATLALLQNADPTGEMQPDSAELVGLEEQCREMGPLIDQELEKIDREHNALVEHNMKLKEAFQLYHSLMTELPTYGYVPTGPRTTLPQSQMYSGQPYRSMSPQVTSNMANSIPVPSACIPPPQIVYTTASKPPPTAMSFDQSLYQPPGSAGVQYATATDMGASYQPPAPSVGQYQPYPVFSVPPPAPTGYVYNTSTDVPQPTTSGNNEVYAQQPIVAQSLL